MHRFVTGWLKPKPLNPKKRMSFLFVIYCPDCAQLSSVSRMGACPKCGSMEALRADGWDFDKTGIRDLHLGKVKANG